MTQTPEQISNAAHAATDQARTAAEFLAAAALHLAAAENGTPAYSAGHKWNANTCKIRAAKAAAKAAGNTMRADRIERGLQSSYQIGR